MPWVPALVGLGKGAPHAHLGSWGQGGQQRAVPPPQQAGCHGCEVWRGWGRCEQVGLVWLGGVQGGQRGVQDKTSV